MPALRKVRLQAGRLRERAINPEWTLSSEWTFKKALLGSAFFLCLALASATLAQARCPLPEDAQSARLSTLFDGDSLRLAKGRQLRLIGINTPEMGRDGRPDEPLAVRARQAAQAFLSDRRLFWVKGEEPRDHYGRWLAHVYNSAGDSLEAHLLARGLGWSLSMTPNLRFRDCLRQAEAQARRQGLGVWSHPAHGPRRATQLDDSAGGFGRYRGRVTGAGENRSVLYLELDDRIFVSADRRFAPWFEGTDLKALEGHRVEVRGWLSQRNLSASQRQRGFKPFRLRIRHPDAIQRLGP